MIAPVIFELTQTEKESALWKKIEARLRDRLTLRQAQIDSDKTFDETCKLRGRIAELKELLALADPALKPQ